MSREEAMGTINYTSDTGVKEAFTGEFNPEEEMIVKEMLLDKLIENPEK